MNPRGDWARVKALFMAALDVPEAERAQWIAAQSADDPDTLEELRSLLAAQAGSQGDLLSRGARLFESTRIRRIEACGPESGARVGPYVLLHEIGAGGMGRVFLARRDDGQFERLVALKLIRSEFASAELLRRFLRERDVLARLAHPNIATLLDGGVADDDAPYFTMEYVEGEPIGRWCDARQLGVHERVALVVKICDAVQYAHRNLIVHRDIKPSNILVTADGEPKLLDFGIAKPLAAQVGDETATAVHPMTREYAAPEQVLGEPVTTATDVYALGVLLYELLSGRLPYAAVERGEIGWSKAVVEEAPEPLSRAPARPRRSADSMDAPMHALPLAQLRRTLRGDLERIVHRALEKVPSARYVSVAALADDLQAYLDGRAISGGSARYRIGKFVRRHAIAVAAGVTVALVALMGIATVLWEARQTAEAGQRAQAVQSFLTRVFDVSDPDRAQGRAVTARELLDEGARRAKTELADQPRLEADFLRLIGSLYFRLGHYEQALELQARAIGLERQLANDRELARALTEAADTERTLERHADAGRDLREALALEARTGDDDARGLTLGALGALSDQTGRTAEADTALREALRLDAARHRKPHERIAADEERLARVVGEEARYDEAERLLKDALEQRRALHGERHSTVADTMIELGKLAWDRGDLAAAERDFTEAVSLRRELFGSNHASVASGLYWLGGLESYAGRYDEAEASAREALAINREVFGAGTAHDAAHHDLLAEVAESRNDLDGAEREVRTALDIWRRVLGEQHTEFANGLQRLALVLRDRGNYAEATRLLEQTLAIRRRALGDDSDRVAFTLTNLGDVVRRGGDPARAASCFEQALAIYRAKFGPSHLRIVEALTGLGRSRLDGGDTAAATATLEEAMAMARAVYPPHHPDLVRVLHPLGLALLSVHRYADAQAALVEAKALLDEHGNAAHVRNRIETSLALAEALIDLQRYDEAAAELREANDLLVRSPQGADAALAKARALDRTLRDARAAHNAVGAQARSH